MIRTLKDRLRRSRTVIQLYLIYQNYRAKRRFTSGAIEAISGSRSEMNLDEKLQYIDTVFNDYLQQGGVRPEDIEGKSILEIGPGDNLGVAAKFLASGARSVICLDKFYSKRDKETEFEVYRALRESLSTAQRKLFDESFQLHSDGTFSCNSDKLESVYGRGIEQGTEFLPEAGFDFIISRAVLEHVYDPDAALEVMAKLLKPDGYLLHEVDFRDHGMFSASGLHPLTFLTISDTVWRWMTYHLGAPNRRLIDYWRDKMAALGLESRYFISSILGQKDRPEQRKESLQYLQDYSEESLALIRTIRPKLIKRYRTMKDEDLLISGIFIVARNVSVKRADQDTVYRTTSDVEGLICAE